MNDSLIFKSNYFINAKYKFTIAEQRAFLKIISKVNPSDQDFKEYEIKVSDILKDAKVKNKSQYKILKKAIENLTDKKVVIPYGKEDIHLTRLILTATTRKNDGKIKIVLDPKLKPHFLNLKDNYTKYKLLYTLSLKSNYSIRLYELLKQYEKIGQREFFLKDLRELLGVDENKYKKYSNFKTRILIKSREELIKHTDITFEIFEKTAWKKVEKIIFKIVKNEPKEPLMALEPGGMKLETHIAIIYELFSENEAKKIQANYSDDYIKANLKEAEKAFKPEIGTFKSCVKSFLENDRIEFNKKKIKEDSKAKVSSLKDETERKEQKKIAEKKQQAEEILNAISDEEYQILFTEIKAKKSKEKGFNMFSKEMQKTFIDAEIVDLKIINQVIT